MRKTTEEIQKIKKDLVIDTLWSWSRYKTFVDDPFEYYLKYVKKVPPDRRESIYAPLGSVAHELLELYHLNEINKNELPEMFHEKLYELKLFGAKYNCTDEEKNKSIGDRYEKNLEHFFNNYEKPSYPTTMEEFLLIKISDNTTNIWFQGYADCIHETKDEEGQIHIWITDFKTSSKYTKEKQRDMAGQLMLYALGMHQKTGIPFERIHIQFDFLKYVTCKYQLKNKKIKEQHVERCLLEDKFPDLTGVEVGNCMVEIIYEPEDIEKLKNKIIKTIEEIELKETALKSWNGNQQMAEHLFWSEVTEDRSYFMANLSDYSPNLHIPYQKYLTAYATEEDLNWLDNL